MKTNQIRSEWRWSVFVALVIGAVQGGLLGSAHAQDVLTTVQGISAPLYVGNLKPILGPFGRPLPGAHAAPICSLVELRVVDSTYGLVPPHTNGMSHPKNPLLTPDSRGGIGLNTSCANNGLFCMVLPQRPGGDVQVFARAYNAPTAAEATFYADSEPVSLSQAATSELVLTFSEARPIDWHDDDGDGLANSWEKLLGTDGVATNDFDGDGMLDLHEWLAGTDPTCPDSKLVFEVVRRETQPHNQDHKRGLLFVPQYNLRISAIYLKYLHKKYNGNWSLTLAAYNWGETNVSRRMRSQQIEPKTNYQERFRDIPETYNYIGKILPATKKA